MYNQLFGKYFKASFIIFILVDLLSFIAYQNSLAQLIIFLVISLLVLGLTLFSLELGIYLLLAELFIGSQGHLFSLSVSDFNFSIRLAIFIIIFLVWLTKVWQKPALTFFNSHNKFLFFYLLLFIILVAGALNGFLNNSLKTAFFDLNGWLFFAISPVIFSQVRSARVVQNIFSILLAAVLFISLKTLMVLILFAYQWPINISVFYQWLRDSRIGEITHVSGTFYRIFFQAQIYVLFGFIISLLPLIFRNRLSLSKLSISWLTTIAILSSTALLACLSRSFWVGAVSALFVIFILLIFKYRLSFSKIVKLATMLMVVGALELGFLLIASGTITTTWLRGRLENPTTESAGMSRVAQLSPLWEAITKRPFLGSGFGKTVTYFTDDPRITALSPSGLYTTYAFEWGYLDIWLKIGLIGLLIYLSLYYFIFQQGLKLIKTNPDYSLLIYSVLLSLLALMATSVFSPYLNHPLGIGYIILISALFNFLISHNGPEQNQVGHQFGYS